MRVNILRVFSIGFFTFLFHIHKWKVNLTQNVFIFYSQWLERFLVTLLCLKTYKLPTYTGF